MSIRGKEEYNEEARVIVEPRQYVVVVGVSGTSKVKRMSSWQGEKMKSRDLTRGGKREPYFS